MSTRRLRRALPGRGGEARFEGAEREAPETGDATAALPWHRGRLAAAQPTR